MCCCCAAVAVAVAASAAFRCVVLLLLLLLSCCCCCCWLLPAVALMKMSEGPPRHASPSLFLFLSLLPLAHALAICLSSSLLRLVDFVVCLGVQAATAATGTGAAVRANGRLINSIIALGVCKKKTTPDGNLRCSLFVDGRICERECCCCWTNA